MTWSLQQVAEHNHSSSCWVIINRKVYDVTDFLGDHPGGPSVILKFAGRDATLAYESIHPPDTLDRVLPLEMHLGSIDANDIATLEEQGKNRSKTAAHELRREQSHNKKPPLSRILNLKEMESVARNVMPYKAWAYYSSASDDEISKSENARAFTRFFFQPRVMRSVSCCDPSTTILGYKSSIPVFVSAAALATLGHPLGEENITRGLAETSIIQTVSSNASLSFASIIAAASPSQTLFFQLYKHANNDPAAKRVMEVEALGYKAIWLTVDALVPGNREDDIRVPWVLDENSQGGENTDAVDFGGTAGGLVKNDDRNMTWQKTIPWLRSVTKLPIVVKGIQCVADAVLAAEAGVDGILLSNHGGRQLDYSLPPVEVLHRLRQQRSDVFDKLEVYIDGGITRGTDVLKALCLGARAVGLGRAFLYAQSAYGAAGITHIVRILEREIVTGMRLLGASTVKDLTPEMVQRVDWQPLVAKL